MFKHLRTYFFTGLFLLIPVAITLMILVWGFNQSDAILGNLIYRIFKVRIIGLGLISLLLLIILTGVLAHNFLGRKLIQFAENILHKIPILSSIYRTTKQITVSFTKADKNLFRKVVLVEYPRAGIFSPGFQIGTAPLEITEKTAATLVGVFIPTVPNPTTGFLIYVPEKNVIFLDMSIEEGFKLVISAGVIKPD
ncbi:MAG TPA: DUF502 domain-containing protein [Firmicutes bacterium]|nr:DUF502 domain-containing protein [Bacillota bacterium]